MGNWEFFVPFWVLELFFPKIRLDNGHMSFGITLIGFF
jgi:hypothetical protein